MDGGLRGDFRKDGGEGSTLHTWGLRRCIRNQLNVLFFPHHWSFISNGGVLHMVRQDTLLRRRSIVLRGRSIVRSGSNPITLERLRDTHCRHA